jgi:hypothetical protein
VVPVIIYFFTLASGWVKSIVEIFHQTYKTMSAAKPDDGKKEQFTVDAECGKCHTVQNVAVEFVSSF